MKMRMCLLFFVLALCPFNLYAQITRTQLSLIQSAFQMEYGTELATQQAALSINKDIPAQPDMWWNLDTVHASYVTIRENGVRQHNLYIFGGYARLPGMTVDGVIAVLCHELGHGIGGTPHKDNGEKELVSTEGQSDYFAYKSCLPRMMKRVSPTQPPRAASSKIEKICLQKTATSSERIECYRFFEVMEIERDFFAKHDSTPTPTDYDTPDQSIVKETDLNPYYYPSPQCRIDTMLAGYFQQPRPLCWFKGSP